MDKKFYCYLLQSTSQPNLTYIGYTTDLTKRLKMHNGELKGGAKATRRCNDWKVHTFVTFNSKSEAQSFEWYWKHVEVNGRWCRTPPGIENKLARLNDIK